MAGAIAAPRTGGMDIGPQAPDRLRMGPRNELERLATLGHIGIHEANALLMAFKGMGVSDLTLQAGRPPMGRIQGRMAPAWTRPLTRHEMLELLGALTRSESSWTESQEGSSERIFAKHLGEPTKDSEPRADSSGTML